MKPLARSMLASLLALTPTFLPGASRAQQMCQDISERIRTADPPAADTRWVSPMKVLAELPDPVLRLDPGKSLTVKAATELLKTDLHASSRLVDAVTKLSEPDGHIGLYRFATSELQAAQANQGSAGCQSFVFFVTRPDGQTEMIDEPPILHNRKEGSPMPCSGFGSLAGIGDVGGTPAFIVEQGHDMHEEITVTPWQAAGWQKSCQLVMDFSAEVTVAEQFCAKGIDCTKAGQEAKALALRYDQDENAFADDAQLDEKLRALKKRAADGPVGSRDFPSFDAKPRYDAAQFAETTVTVPVMLDGQAYVAKIGHGSIGWRTYPDYLVGLYRLTGDDFDPVAGIIVTKARSKPVTVTVK